MEVYHFCPLSITQNSAVWPHARARQSGKGGPTLGAPKDKENSGYLAILLGDVRKHGESWAGGSRR